MFYLTATASIDPGSSGGFNASALKSPNSVPMYVEEIRFSVTSAGVITGSNLGVNLQLGRLSLTNGYVPVSMFARPEAWERDQYSSSYSTYERLYYWRLPRPLYVPPGQLLLPTIQSFGQVTQTVHAAITYTGRAAEALQGLQPIPYAARWASNGLPYDTAATANSTEQDLVNRSGRVLNLQRLLGRVTAGVTSGYEDMQSPTSALMTVRISDSKGNPIVKNYSPWNSVFPITTKSIEMDNVTVDVDDYLVVYVNKVAPAVPVGTGDTTQIIMGLVGWYMAAVEEI